MDQLTTAMEFRTDGLIIILEDEQRYLHDPADAPSQIYHEIYLPDFYPHLYD